MKRSLRFLLVTAGIAGFLCAASSYANAQTSGGSASSSATDTRPATTTFFGDTGLWFVPTAEVLPARKGSVSGYRANWDRTQGFSDISHFAVTFGVGLGDRAELFGSLRAVTRIDRDVRSIFHGGSAEAGGLLNEYPLVRDGWASGIGDLVVGAKLNVLSEHRQQPVAFALRGTVKLPTGDKDNGLSSGKTDAYVDAIVSKEAQAGIELSGYGGVAVRGNPENLTLANGVRWGVGAGFPTRRRIRLFTEVRGEVGFDSAVTAATALSGADASLSPLSTPFKNPIDATVGLVWQGASGLFAGAGLGWSLRVDGRSKFGSAFGNVTGDALGFQARVGYHPGTRIYAPPPPPPPPPTAPPPPANRPPTVKARCEPCTVEVGASSTVSADAQDPDGDALTYRWSAPAGALAAPAERQSRWTAPMQEGPVPVTITVDDGKAGTATDTVRIQVIKPAVKEFVFEDVHFDFDRYSLRPDAVRVLDEAVRSLQENPTLRIEIEGHTCNIGTAEYNLALGERRATAARDYLTSRGIGADRLRTVSYGEERPKHDNSREETRRLNRRAAMVVRVQ